MASSSGVLHEYESWYLEVFAVVAVASLPMEILRIFLSRYSVSKDGLVSMGIAIVVVVVGRVDG